MLEKVGIDKDQCHDALEDAQDVRTLVRRMAKQNDYTFQEFVRDNRQVTIFFNKTLKQGLVSYLLNKNLSNNKNYIHIQIT